MSSEYKLAERGHAIEDSGLAARDEFGAELATSSAAAQQQHEIQSAMVIAKRFPRNEDQAFQTLMRSCKRSSFAEICEYRFPRGKTNVIGPTVYLAREAARIWGNIRYGFDIIRDDDDMRVVRSFAWDVQTNSRVHEDASFKKLVQRKNKETGKTEWVTPDERDLRELTNKHGAFGVRNCLLQLIPRDIIDDARAASHETKREGAKKDPDGTRKATIAAFDRINITVAMLEQYLGHSLAQCSPDELADLRSIWKAISDGQARWADYAEEKTASAAPKATVGDAMKSTLEKLSPSESVNPKTGEVIDAKPAAKGDPGEALAGGGEPTDDEKRAIAAEEEAEWRREQAKKGG